MKMVYISGIDGCGKTTQSLLLEKALIRQEVSSQYVWLRWDPSFRKAFDFLKLLVRKKIHGKSSVKQKEKTQHYRWRSFKKRILSNRLLCRAWWEYACLDYYLSLKKQIKGLSNTDFIIVDRYIHDFIIDQAINLDISLDDQISLAEKLKAKGFRFPDFSIIINLPAEEGYRRKLDGTAIDYLKERELRYKMISNMENTINLDGMETIETLSKKIEGLVLNKFALNKNK